FVAAYMRYTRYVDPFTGAPARIEDTIGLLSDLVRREKKTSARSVAVGFSLWRRSFAPHFAGRDVAYAGVARGLPRDRDRVIIWSSHADRLRKAGRLAPAVKVTYMEDGFVRSRGLGAKLAR